MIKHTIQIMGIDDATKCPCIGSIFIAGVTAKETVIKKWKQLGVTDSKCLSRKRREELAHIIQETAHAFSIQEIKPTMIDNKTLNLNEWEMAICLSIMDDICKQTSVQYAYIDNWEVNTILFWQRLDSMLSQDLQLFLNKKIDVSAIQKIRLIPEHQADEKYVIVGAASILAKTASDFQYDRYKEQYGDFGSGNPGDPATRFFVWKHRHNPPHIIRTSWNTYKVVSQLQSIEDDPLRTLKNKRLTYKG